MQLKKGVPQPCPSCLRARNRIRSVAGRIAGRAKKKSILVECERGDLTVEVHGMTITAQRGFTDDLLGTEVYIGGRWVRNVVTTEFMQALGRIVKVSAVD